MSAQAPHIGYQYVRPVPAYRRHRKRSKTGCLPCRNRRKKCDEGQPVCSECKERHLECSWPINDSASRLRRRSVGQSRVESGVESHRGICMPVGSTNPSPIGTPNNALLLDGHSPSTTSVLPEETLQTPCDSTLLEHFVSRTSHILAGRESQQNPWLHSILPMAHLNSLTMHAVLAISGVHMIHYKPDNTVEQATYAHYGEAVKQLNGTLATWVCGGSQQDTLHLFVAANLLIMYELVEGDSNGNLVHHLRACGTFARQVLAHKHSDDNHALIGFSLENYVYSALLARLTEADANTACESFSSCQDLLSLLDLVQTYRTFGSLLGCAHQLYRLIPEVANYTWCSARQTTNCPYHDSFETYKALENRIESWSSNNVSRGSLRDRRISTAEYANGVMIRNTLLMVLRYSWIRHRDACEQAMNKLIQPLIDDNLMLEELLAHSPAVNVSLWPLMITGSMMRDHEQRLALALKLKAHHTQAPVTSCAVRLLSWLWNDCDNELFGLEALVSTARKHGARVCFA